MFTQPDEKKAGTSHCMRSLPHTIAWLHVWGSSATFVRNP